MRYAQSSMFVWFYPSSSDLPHLLGFFLVNLVTSINGERHSWILSPLSQRRRDV